MRNLAVVTSCHGYGRYLAEWAEALIATNPQPGLVAIFTHGDPLDQAAGAEAVAALAAAGLRARHEHEAARLDFGAARNRAVALADTEWVMHLDADDLLLPHAVQDIAALAPGCDIVALGYERAGDLAAGPRQRTKLYRASAGADILRNPTPCSGVSPFRRALWQQRPYRTDLIGGWDTALWIGFGHLGARILPTRRPCFLYRQHADSVFNTRRRDLFRTALAGRTFEGLRAGYEGVSVVVPRQADGAERDGIWRWLRPWWAQHFPSWELVEGETGPGDWRKGEAVAAGLARARGRVLVLADADVMIDPDTLRAAVALVESRAAPWVVPHTLVHRLGPEDTGQAMRDPPAAPPVRAHPLARAAYPGFPGGGVVVVGRAEYEAVGGIPRHFVGWGAEDEALALLLDTLVGPHSRLPADLWHFWHPPAQRRAGRSVRQVQANRLALAGYLAARGDPVRMYAVARSGEAGASSPYWNFDNRNSTLAARAASIRAQVETVTRDRFAEARLAASHLRKDGRNMAGALDTKHETLRIRREQAARNAEAARLDAEARARLPLGRSLPPLERKPHPAPVETKPEGEGPETKPEGEAGVPREVVFAKSAARKAAEAAGLVPEDFAGIEPGVRGYTLAHVREAVAGRDAARAEA